MNNGIQFIVRQMQICHARPATREEMRQRVAYLRQTKAQRAVAAELGISRSTVFNMLHEGCAKEVRP